MGHESGAVQGLPGLGPVQQMETVKFLRDNNHIVRRGVIVHKDTDDFSRPPGSEHKLKGGLVVVRVEAGVNKNLYVDPLHPDAPLVADVKEAGILMESFSMHGPDGVRVNKSATVLIHGFVDELSLVFGTAVPAYIDALKAALHLVEFFKPVP